jgi:RNA polymerase sigma factor (sigma-70 family)
MGGIAPMETVAAPSPRSGRRYMMAVVLGTALTAFGATNGLAAQPADVSAKTINDISRYCTVCWRNARLPVDSWSDCTQDVFRRLLERVVPSSWILALKGDGLERREFLRAIDAVKKRTQRSQKRSSYLNGIVADPRSELEQRFADERAAVSQAATELLSPRQQRILQMCFEGWAVQDIAEELALPAERVSDEKYKAIRKLREHLAERE